MIKKMFCIVCPMSCHLEVEMQDNEVLSVCGNTCPRGEAYARSESVHPMRMLTSTVFVEHGEESLVPVITDQSVPKEKMSDIMDVIKTLHVTAPVAYGTIIKEHIAGCEANLIATGEVRKV